MKEIPLTQGKVALVDDDDYEWLIQWKWHYHRSSNDRGGYAATWGSHNLSPRPHTMMHRLILGATSGSQIDHVNHNGLDNRRCNLRLCTRSQNAANQRAWDRCKTSQFKGVSWHKSTRKWIAYGKAYQKMHHLGLFGTEREAAQAYNEFAVKTWGEFARVNIISEGETK